MNSDHRNITTEAFYHDIKVRSYTHIRSLTGYSLEAPLEISSAIMAKNFPA